MPSCQTRKNTLLLVSTSMHSCHSLVVEFNRITFNSILTKPVREENLRSMLQIADEQQKSRTAFPSLIGSPENQDPMDNALT